MINELNNYFLDMTIEIRRVKNDKESNLLSLNINKAKKILNWSPILSFKESVKLTAEWYEAYFNKNDIKLLRKNKLIIIMINL